MAKRKPKPRRKARPKKAPGGRPRFFGEPSRAEKLFQILRAGGSRADAAKKLGTTLDTITNEAKRDQSFSDGLIAAEIDGKISAIATIAQASQKKIEGDWKAAAWLLERKHWQEWSRRTADSVSPRQLTSIIARVVAVILDLLPADKHDEARRRIDQTLAHALAK